MMVAWTLLLLHVHLVGFSVTALPAPSNVSIHSFNMEHTLSFLPGRETPPDTHFTVEIIHLRQRGTWRTVTGCLKLMSGQMCNLTRALKNEFGQYQARVRAVTPSQTSNWTMSKQFEPLFDTVLGPPIVSVSGCGNCLLLQISMPMTNGLQNYQLLQNLHRSLTIHVHRVKDGAEFTINLPYKKENVITYLQPGVEHCVTVSVTSFLNSNSVPSKPTCAFTSPHPPSRSSLGVVFGLLGGICVTALLLFRFLCWKSELQVNRKSQSNSLLSLPRSESWNCPTRALNLDCSLLDNNDDVGCQNL